MLKLRDSFCCVLSELQVVGSDNVTKVVDGSGEELAHLQPEGSLELYGSRSTCRICSIRFCEEFEMTTMSFK